MWWSTPVISCSFPLTCTWHVHVHACYRYCILKDSKDHNTDQCKLSSKETKAYRINELSPLITNLYCTAPMAHEALPDKLRNSRHRLIRNSCSFRPLWEIITQSDYILVSSWGLGQWAYYVNPHCVPHFLCDWNWVQLCCDLLKLWVHSWSHVLTKVWTSV